MTDEKRILERNEFLDAAKKAESTDGFILRKGAILQGVEEIGSNEDNADNGDDVLKLRFVISSPTVDRDNDTINVAGWHLEEYLKNPVVLWAHDSYLPPVGKALTLEMKNNALISEAEFMPRDMSEFSYMVFQMYKQKFLNAVSVGFQPIKWVHSEERPHGIDFIEQALYEYSAVPVPSNPEALQVARAKGINTEPLFEWAEKMLDEKGYHKILVPKTVMESVRKNADDKGTFQLFVGLKGEDNNEFEITEDMQKQVGEVEDEQADENTAVCKRAISYNSAHEGGTGKATESVGWDGPAEVAAAEVDDLKIMCTWVDEENADIKGSYKLPHHKASGHDVVWNGVKAAMGALLGARGGADIPAGERRGVYNHLKKHYQEFDKEVPEFRFCEAEVLRTLPELFYFDYESGQLKETASYEAKKVTDNVTNTPGSAESDSKGLEMSREDLNAMVGESITRHLNKLTGKLD